MPGGDASGTAAASRQDADAAKRLRRFARDNGGDVVAVIDHVGRVGARVVLIAGSGEFGDALATSVGAATTICDRLSIPVRGWDRETTGLLAPSAADRVRMGTRRR